MIESFRIGTLSAVCIGLGLHVASALPVLWGNGAGAGSSLLQQFDLETGKVPTQFFAPNDGQNEHWGGDAGRGIAIVGDTIFHTTSGSGKIFKTHAITKEDLGYVLDTGLWGLRSLAFDGSTFWVRNEGYGPVSDTFLRRYSVDGTLLAILPNISGPFDVWENNIIARDATGFGRYDFGGKHVGHLFDFSHPLGYGEGIAFDGDYFAYVSGFSRFTLLDSKGNRVKETLVEYPRSHRDDRVFTDLSFDRQHPSTEAIPEPGTFALLLLGLIPLALAGKRKRA